MRPPILDGRVARVAARAGLTEGQVYTIAIGLAIAIVTLSIGLPSAARQTEAATPPRVVALPPGTPPLAPAPQLPLPPIALPTLPAFPLPLPGPFVPPAFPPSPAGPRPLAIVGFGWATSDAGTPLETILVPDAGMPVSRRLGNDHWRTFVRLDGDTTILRLGLVESQTANVLDALAVVQACPITVEGWSIDAGQSFEESPAYDCTSPAVAVRREDGTFVFDLAAFPDRGGSRGFALVSAPSAPPSFQLVFSPTALPPS